MTAPQTTQFFDRFQFIVLQKELIKLTLTNKREKSSDLKKIIITAVELKKGYCLNFVYRHNTKDITKNYELEQGFEIIKESLSNDFFNADIYANSENISYLVLPNGKTQIKTTAPSLQKVNSFTHDKVKDRLIDSKENIYLRELGVTNDKWEVRHEMSDKYKQINKYIELLAPEIKEISLNNNFQVVDMGSGKGYLTFALYDYLSQQSKNDIGMTGIEYREDLVNICNSIAQKSDFKNLKFIQGTIAQTKIDEIDLLIALHACDTATDDAIFRGIQANATMIVCAPCCHKQIRKSFNVNNELSAVMKFGILKERQAEIITDTLRAMIMEAYGYKTKVVEFISSEHTPKNVMIAGRKIQEINPNKQAILDNIAAIKKTFGIENHYLETLLGI
jgi:hypothetical protein